MSDDPDDSDRNHRARIDTHDLAEVVAAMKALSQAPGAVRSDKFDKAVDKLPGKGEWIKAAPAVAFVCGTTIMLAIVTVFTVLTITGSPTDQFFRLINLFFNALGAFGTLTLILVALTQARRSMESRRFAQMSHDEAHRAADAATSAAKGVNGDLARIVSEAASRAAHDAVTEVLRERRDPRPPR